MAPTWSDNSGLHVLRGGTLWHQGEFQKLDVFVEKGQIAGLLSPGTSVSQKAKPHNLDGTWLLAGLSDCHGHLYGLGDSLDMPRMRHLRSWSQILSLVQQEAEKKGPGAAIKLFGWDDSCFENPGLPDPASLLDLFPDRPVLLLRVDGHCALANRVALEQTGLIRQEADYPADHLVRDQNGQPNGLLMESAVEHARRFWPIPSKNVVRSKILNACNQLVGAGHVAFGDMGSPDWVLEELAAMDLDGVLPLKVFASLDGEAEGWENHLATWQNRNRRAKDFHLIGLKVYADGALGSSGAELLEDYQDQPGHKGVCFHDTQGLQTRARAALKAGLQIQIHAIGDGACQRSLDALEPLFSGPNPGRPWARIEHGQMIVEKDLERMARLGVAACIQPSHFASDAKWIRKRIGEARLPRAYRWASLVNGGVLVGGGADTPIEKADPALGLKTLVQRCSAPGTSFGPEEKLTPEQAVAVYTVNNGKILGWPRLGETSLGAPAAFGLLAENPFENP